MLHSRTFAHSLLALSQKHITCPGSKLEFWNIDLAFLFNNKIFRHFFAIFSLFGAVGGYIQIGSTHKYAPPNAYVWFFFHTMPFPLHSPALRGVDDYRPQPHICSLSPCGTLLFHKEKSPSASIRTFHKGKTATLFSIFGFARVLPYASFSLHLNALQLVSSSNTNGGAAKTSFATPPLQWNVEKWSQCYFPCIAKRIWRAKSA